MITTLIIISLTIFIFIIIFSLERAREKKQEQQKEHEKIREYGEKINQETRNKSKWFILKVSSLDTSFYLKLMNLWANYFKSKFNYPHN